MTVDAETERALNDLIFACEKRNPRFANALDTAHFLGKAMLEVERLNEEMAERVVSMLQQIGYWPRPIEQGPRQNGLAPPPLPSENVAQSVFDRIYGMEAAE